MVEEIEIDEHEIEKKELPCLKCERIILTHIYKRICDKCTQSNERIVDKVGKFPTNRRSAKQNTFKVD